MAQMGRAVCPAVEYDRLMMTMTIKSVETRIRWAAFGSSYGFIVVLVEAYGRVRGADNQPLAVFSPHYMLPIYVR